MTSKEISLELKKLNPKTMKAVDSILKSIITYQEYVHIFFGRQLSWTNVDSHNKYKHPLYQELLEDVQEYLNIKR